MATPQVHQLLIDTVTREDNCVLQFDSEHQVLRSWLWPKETSGVLVAPEKLREHRTLHDFLGPCCFCPALRGQDPTNFVEAAMFDRGNGEIVAMCPTDNCGYLVFLGRIFERGNMPTATYPKRRDQAIKPPRQFHQSEDIHNVFKRANKENVELKDDIRNVFKRANKENVEPKDALPNLSPGRGVLPRSVKYKTLIHQLDSIVQPGVSENSLKLLLAKCNKCGKITTRRVFVYHAC